MKGKIAYIVTPNVSAVLQKTGFLDEFALLKPHFATLGFDLVAADWRDKAIDWKIFDFVIPKNIWNYFDHYPEFLVWLQSLKEKSVPLKNSAEIILWNSNKQYLYDMLQAGASVAPLQLLSSEKELSHIEAQLQSSERVLLKPSVSGGGKQTRVYTKADLQSCLEDATEILKDSPVIVQPFLPEVANGEWSFFFFGANYSHAIVKTPQSGDFRAHSLFGARNTTMTPSTAQIEEAHSFLQYAPSRPHYTRVDGIYVKDRLHLIELEMIEPYLYLEHASKSASFELAKTLL